LSLKLPLAHKAPTWLLSNRRPLLLFRSPLHWTPPLKSWLTAATLL